MWTDQIGLKYISAKAGAPSISSNGEDITSSVSFLSVCILDLDVVITISVVIFVLFIQSYSLKNHT